MNVGCQGKTLFRVAAIATGLRIHCLSMPRESLRQHHVDARASILYSLGMKQRLAIAATLIGDPKIVIFDEPTNGLDPQGIAEVRSVLKDIASRGRTVIMASHILDEVEKICSHVTILKKGKILSSGPVGSILSDNVTLEIGAENRDTLVKFLETYPGIISVKLTGNHLECKADESILIAELNKKAISSDIKINHLIARKSRLEEEFLEIVKGHKSN